MKVCVTFVGVTRPTLERVQQNLETNISYFASTYSQHTFTYVLVTYKNQFSEGLAAFCKEKGISAHFIDPMVNPATDFSFQVKLHNAYRLFYSMSYAVNKIKEPVDCVVRIRTDMEVKSLEIKEPIVGGVYYTVKGDFGYSDNIGYGSYSVMKSVWKHENARLPGTNMEDFVMKSFGKYNYAACPFRFQYILHQSSDVSFDGIPQWSKRSREWISDGKNIIENPLE